MIAYIDASVILRITLQQARALPAWEDLTAGATSVLARVECHRTYDRLFQQGALDRRMLHVKRLESDLILSRLEVVPINDAILETAAAPLRSPLGTLDAIHLATALELQRARGNAVTPLLFATHDLQLARAARAHHFDVIGAS